MNAPSLPPTLAERTARLKGLDERLRTNHFGIDSEIQCLLDAFAPWYKFAETQARPRCIGLWGMTGTGKSSLVRALVKDAGLEDHTYWLDAGESGEEYWLDKVFCCMDEHLSGHPFILVVDEFQHARTVVNGITQQESGMLRRFWELLDSGRVVTLPALQGYRASYAHDIEDCIRAALRAGAIIRNGIVVEGKEVFKKSLGKFYEQVADEQWAIPEERWDLLRDLHLHPLPTLSDIRQKLSSLDGAELLEWLKELRSNSGRTRVVDASKMMVILLGNLDELYVGEQEPLAELDPDVLWHRHRNIGRAGVQAALTKLFRIEQVGRIGRSHVVFPPIGRSTVDTLIRHAAQDLAGRLSASCGRSVVVDDRLVDHLRATSTIAVLGARPVVEAVQNTVPLLLSQALELPGADAADAFTFTMADGVPVVSWRTGDQEQRTELAWQEDTANTNGNSAEWMETAAIHEAGHLLCGVLLCGKRPLQVCARTRDPRVRGFVAWDLRPDRPFLRTQIVPELAVLLGGWAAETVFLGADNISASSGDDLKKATAFALNMAMNQGMGMDRLHHALHRTSEYGGFHITYHEAEAHARQWIEEAEALALATLQEHRDLFGRCVERLKEKGSLGMKELGTLLNNEVPTVYLEPEKMEQA